MPAKFLCNLTKNLTAFLPHTLCAVLPKKKQIGAVDARKDLEGVLSYYERV